MLAQKSELEIQTQLNLTCGTDGARSSKIRAADARSDRASGQPKVRVVKGVQEFRLEFEFEPFRESGVFGDGYVKVDEMRAIKPGMETKYSRRGVGLNGGICCAQGLENLGIYNVHESAADVVNANGILQL